MTKLMDSALLFAQQKANREEDRVNIYTATRGRIDTVLVRSISEGFPRNYNATLHSQVLPNHKGVKGVKL